MIENTLLPQRRKARQDQDSKQFQNDERQNQGNVPNRRERDRRFEFSEFVIYLAVVCFGPRGRFRVSEFGFVSLLLGV